MKNPVSTLAIVVTLALCIGANTAIFSLVNTILFRPLPFPRPNELVLIATKFARNGASGMNTSHTGAEWQAIRDQVTLLDSAVYGSTAGLNLVSGNHADYVLAQRVGANLFRVLGVQPLLGREITRAEDVPNGPPVVMLSYNLWQRTFHSDPAIIGRAVDLRGVPHTIVGVLPSTFTRLPGSAQAPDAWISLRASTEGEGVGSNYAILARLKPKATRAAVNSQLQSAMLEVFRHMGIPKDVMVEEVALPLQAGITRDLRTGVYTMWAAVGVLLLIGCVNVGALLLSRSSLRSREIALRKALGASRVRIVTELVRESFILSLFGAAVGLAVGKLALNGIMELNPGEFTVLGAVAFDTRVFISALFISVSACLLFGIYPAIAASATDLRTALAEAGRSTAGLRTGISRHVLVFAELSLSVVLVITAGLLTRTFLKVVSEEPGFDPTHVTVASASMLDRRYADATAGSRLFRESLERIRTIPGVESAAVALAAPYTRPMNQRVSVVDGRPVDGITELNYATPDLFHTLRMPLLRGRSFTQNDGRSDAPFVAVVNDAFVRRFIERRHDPVGAIIEMANRKWNVIGVVPSVEETNGIDSKSGPIGRYPEVYVPVSRFPGFEMANTWFSPVWIVRTRSTDPQLQHLMQQALSAVDPRLPFASFESIEKLRTEETARERYRAVILISIAGLALLLAAVGLYGLSAQIVVQRTREAGIRMALGATLQKVVQTCAIPTAAASCAAILCGIAGAVTTSRLLKSLIWNVEPTDAMTYAVVVLILLLVTAFAILLPILRLRGVNVSAILHEQ